jgi:hypothetical protein
MRKIVLSIAVAAAALSLGGCGNEKHQPLPRELGPCKGSLVAAGFDADKITGIGTLLGENSTSENPVIAYKVRDAGENFALLQLSNKGCSVILTLKPKDLTGR